MAPFQLAELPVGRTYDLVFTSPPYFDLEVYTAAPGQSIDEFHGLDAWFNGFLMVMLAKAWAVLVAGGHMVIVINNIRGGDDFVGRMVAGVNAFDGAEYLGVLPYAERRGDRFKSPQPMWIWRHGPSVKST
jgi:DNA modification methylase